MITPISLLLALVVCPIAYAALCHHMKKKKVPRPPYAAFFFLFGTIGGWFLAIAMAPSGLAASCLVFLGTAAPLALLVSAFVLHGQEERTIYHRVAQWAGFCYPTLLAACVAVSLIFFRES